MRRDSYQLHIMSDTQSSLPSSSRLHHCPVMSRLYMSADDGACHHDVAVSRATMRRLSAVSAGPAAVDGDDVCDDVFCTHADDDHRHRHQKHLFHAWAQYRIAQRGIMVRHCQCDTHVSMLCSDVSVCAASLQVFTYCSLPSSVLFDIKKVIFSPVTVCLSVCHSVNNITQKLLIKSL